MLKWAYDLPFDVKTRKFSYYNAKRQGIEITPEYVNTSKWAKVTLLFPLMSLYIERILKSREFLQDYEVQKGILPYSIDEDFIIDRFT